MSNSTPPGWYPLPGAGPDGSAQERWWDGTAWTSEVRSAPPSIPPIADAPTQGWDGTGLSTPPTPPGYGYPPPAPRRSNAGLMVGLVVAAVVVAVIAAIGVGGAVMLSSGSSRSAHPAPPPSPATGAVPTPSPPDGSPTDSPTAQAPVDPDGTVKDTQHGWNVPLPTGWISEQHGASTTLYLATTPYACASAGGCVRGNFAIDAQPTDGADARAVAQTAMAAFGPVLFGDLTSHQELASGPTTVAGLAGYAERWHVVPSVGAPGFVLVVAVPAQGGGFTVLVGSVDDHPDAPQPAVLDQLVAGIRASANTTGI